MKATASLPLPPCTSPMVASVAIIAVCGLLPAEAESLAACAEIVPGPLVSAAISVFSTSSGSKGRAGAWPVQPRISAWAKRSRLHQPQHAAAVDARRGPVVGRGVAGVAHLAARGDAAELRLVKLLDLILVGLRGWSPR